MSGLLKGDLDVAQAMIYNEYAQVLEANNPATGKLYQPSDFNVVDFNDPAVGTAMLQDQIFARASWLSTGDNAATATKFLTATYRGWIYCRDNPDKCVDDRPQGRVPARREPPGLADERDQRAHLAVAGRHRPARPDALPADGDRSRRPTRSSRRPRPADAVRTDLSKAALAALPSGTDANGASFTKKTVTLNAGGN